MAGRDSPEHMQRFAVYILLQDQNRRAFAVIGIILDDGGIKNARQNIMNGD